MRKTDPPGQLQEGWELSPAPPLGPDGTPQFAVPRPPLPPRPRLCEAGPCRHYHRMEIQVDAENPMAQKVTVRLKVLSPGMESVSGGTVYRAPAVFHTSVEHYCYPDVGIETALGPTPVVECNRWDPVRPDHAKVLAADRQHFLEHTPEGRTYADAVAAWEQARSRELAVAAEAERELADALAAQEDLARIDALVDAYTYVVKSTAQASVRGADRRMNPDYGEHVARCVELPSATCADASRLSALEAVRDLVRATLITMNRDGLPLPVPTGSDPPTPTNEEETPS